MPLFLDATRALENACQIAQFEDSFRGRDPWSILKQIFSLADGVTASLGKDFSLNLGGIVAVNDGALFGNMTALAERTGSGLNQMSRKMIALALTDKAAILHGVKTRMATSKTLWQSLVDCGQPLRRPMGGHCVLLDVARMPLFSNLAHPQASFLAWLYCHTGIRAGIHNAGMQKGTVLNSAIRMAVPVGLSVGDVKEIGRRLRVLFATQPPVQDLVLTSKPDGFRGHAKASFKPRVECAGSPEYQREMPLTLAQKGIWLDHGLSPESRAYHLPVAFRLGGSPDLQFLETALDLILARHPCLRTVFQIRREQLVAGVRPCLSLTLQRQVRQQGNYDQIDHFIREEFNLERGPLVRAGLFEGTSPLLVLVFHHLVFDGFSLNILTRELTQAYQTLAAGKTWEPTPVQAHYGDYVHMQQEWLQGKKAERQWDYWRDVLAPPLPVLALPFDYPRSGERAEAREAFGFELDEALVQPLRGLAKANRATLYMVMLAAWQTLLAAYSGQRDLLVGSPVAGRNHARFDGIIGYFVNMICLRGDFSGNPSFLSFLRQTRHRVLQAFKHDHLPFAELVRRLGLDREANRTPVFQAAFFFRNPVPVDQAGLGPKSAKLDMALVPDYQQTSECDITLEMVDDGCRARAWLKYSSALFLHATIRQMAARFTNLVAEIAADPERSALVLVTQGQERRQLLQAWNQTHVPPAYAVDTFYPHLFTARAREQSSRVAVVGRGHRLTYDQLERQSNQLAYHLRALGAGPGHLVALGVDRDPSMLVGLLGILKTGAAYLPMDPHFPADRLAMMLEDGACALLVTGEALEDRWSDSPIQKVLIDRGWDTMSAQPDIPPVVANVDEEALAYVIFTSGSTGRPKGVQVSHGNLINFLTSMVDKPEINSEDRWLSVTTLSFDIAALELLGPLLVGGTVVLADRETQTDAPMLARTIEKEKVTVMQATPATWRLLQAIHWPGFRQMKVLCGGEALPPSLAAWLLSLGGPVWNMYGPTETTIWSTVRQVTKADGLTSRQAVSIGRPINNTSVCLLDWAGNLAPMGIAAGLFIGGAGLARGYIKRPALTADHFLPSPFGVNPGERMYRTGDKGRFEEDGSLHFLGRSDHQVKVRGFRIELGDIEAALGRLDSVSQQAVLAEKNRSGHYQLTAFLVAKGKAPESDSIRDALATSLPDYMIPSAFQFLPRFPLTPNGKVDRRALVSLDRDEPCRTLYRAPLTAVEVGLSALWGEFLSREKVGTEDNFFALGGDSIIAIQVVARARKLGLYFAPRDLFRFPTVASLAPRVRQKESGDLPSVAAFSQVDPAWVSQFGDNYPQMADLYPSSPLQKALAFHGSVRPQDRAYHMQISMSLKGDLDPTLWQTSWAHALSRHEVLRGCLVVAEDDTLFLIQSQVDLPWTFQDWSDADDVEARLNHFLQRDLAAGFAMDKPPLFRLALFRMGAGEFRFVCHHHHLILDGWSLSLLFRDTVQIYRALADNTQIRPHGGRPYREYIAALGRQSTAPASAFWSQYLAGFGGVTLLPLARKPETYGSGRLSVPVEQASLHVWATYCKHNQLTLSTLVQGAWAVLLARHCNQDDLVFGVTTSGRDSGLPGIENMVGLFINTLPLRVAVSGPVLPMLQRIQESLTDMEFHGSLPLYEMGRLAGLAGSQPLFETLVVFENFPVDPATLANEHFSMSDIQAEDRIHYPLNLVFFNGEAASMKLGYDPKIFSPTLIEDLAFELIEILAGIAMGENVLAQRESAPAQTFPVAKKRETSGPASDENQLAENPLQEHLLAIWNKVLGPERGPSKAAIGIHDHFFEIGGHSLLATRVMNRIRKEMGLEIPIMKMFEAPTIAQFSQEMDPESREKRPNQILKANRAQCLPLSPAQMRLWFLELLEGPNATYHISGGLRLRGSLKPEAMECAFDLILSRHESLRTGVGEEGGAAVQIIGDHQPFRLPVFDFTAIADPIPVALTWATKYVVSPFDLTAAGLVRIALLRLDQNDWMLLVVMHHLVSDGWSIGVLVNELKCAYNGFADDRIPALEPLPIQFADYVEWQYRQKAPDQNKETAVYWRDQLAGAPELLELPTDFPRPAAQTYRGDQLDCHLDATLTRALKQLASARNATLFMVLQGAFSLLLSRYSGARDVLIGTPVANRHRAEIEPLIGFFVNTLVLRNHLSGDLCLSTFIDHVRQQALGAFAHQSLSFEQLLDLIQPNRDLGFSPIFQTFFVFNDAPLKRFRLRDLDVELLPVPTGTAKFDLSLYMTESESGLDAAFEFNTDLFHRQTLRRMSGHFVNLLASMVAHPRAKLSHLTMIGEAERRMLLDEWNQTYKPAIHSHEALYHQLFEDNATRHPDRIAVVGRRQRLTYGQLEAGANNVARHLQNLGAGPGAVIALMVDRDPLMLLGLLGIQKTGAAYLPIDPDFPQDRIALMLEDGACAMLVTRERLAAPWTGEHFQVITLDSGNNRFARGSATQPTVATSGSDSRAYVIFTSGSTGRPKGVQISHRNLIQLLQNMIREPGLQAEDRFLSVTTLSFDIAGLELLGPLMVGAHLVLADEETQADARLLAATLDAERITIMQATPATWRLLQAHRWCGSAHLKILCGGEAMPPDLARWLLRAGASVWNLYGPTETTIWSCIHKLHWEKDRCLPANLPLGRPIPNTRVYLLDWAGSPAPVGVTADLLIAGEGVSSGYLNQPGLTASRFLPCPFGNLPGERMYHTGDLARYFPDGMLEFLGRSDHQVKLRGFRIELGEIEATLGRLDSVRDQVVLSEENGAGQIQLVAYVVPAASTPAIEDLRAVLAKSLPEYMLPARFQFLTRFPLTPNGKVNRSAIGSLDEVVRGLQEPPETPLVAPNTSMERDLLRICRRVFGCDQGASEPGGVSPSIGIRHHFFKLGGHSLLATRLVNRIREELGIELPIKTIFQKPILGHLARAMEDLAGTDHGQRISARKNADSLPLSFSQERLWYLDHFSVSNGLQQSSYNISNSVRLVGCLHGTALDFALAAMIHRHEILRTSFQREDGRTFQRIHPTCRTSLGVIDLQTQQQGLALARGLAGQEGRLSFDLQRLPLLRATVFRLGPEDHLLVVTLHHIIFDGWSFDVFIRELMAFYRSESLGIAYPMTPLPIQYADVALWQRRRLENGALENQIAWWKMQLAGIPELHQLPTDRPRPSLQSGRGGVLQSHIPDQIKDQLTHLAGSRDATLFMLLLAAFKALIYRYSNQQDVVVGTPIAGRNREEVESLIGPFINTLVLWTKVAGGESALDLLHGVRETALNAYAHQEAPFECVVDVLSPDRDPGHGPLFQIMFSLQPQLTECLTLPGLQLTPLREPAQTTKFDLSLNCTETTQGLVAEWEFSESLFDRETIQRMATHFQNLLTAVVNQPQSAVDELTFMDEAELQLLKANDQRDQVPVRAQNVQQLVEKQAALWPDRIALASDRVSLTYGQLNRWSNRLARQLIIMGVGNGDAVGISAVRSAETIAAHLSVLKVGACYVPLDPGLPEARLKFMIHETAVRCVLCGAAERAVLGRLGTEILCLDEVDHWPVSETDLGLSVIGEQCAYVMYTSGSTGTPKGVVIPHRAVVRLVEAPDFLDLNHWDRVLCFAPLSFDAATFEMWAPLAKGAQICLVSDGKPDLVALVRFLGTFRVSAAFLSSGLFNGLVDQGLESVRHLRHLLTGGEAMSSDHGSRCLKTLPDCALVHVYGPTESTTFTSYQPLKVKDFEGNPPMGRPIAHTTTHVVDGSMTRVPLGVIGELVIGGLGLAQGYLDRPGLTATRFVPDPFSACPGARLYLSGDLVSLNGKGEILFRGRRDGQVKIRGFRIEIEEIERKLSSHPRVQQVAVLVREDGSAGKTLVAYVQMTHPLHGSDLRLYLSDSLPGYMVPGLFVPMEHLPLNSNGKVDRQQLARRPRETIVNEGTPPRTPLEEQLADIWREVLCLDRVGVLDSFFEIGGHSLLATRVVTRMRHIQPELTLGLFFKDPTIAAMANTIECFQKVIGAQADAMSAEEREEFEF